MDESVGLNDKTVRDALEGTLPWLAPAGLAVEALAALDRPLLAWIQDPEYNEFDSAGFYAEHREHGDKLSKLEEQIAKLPIRQSWRLERSGARVEVGLEDQGSGGGGRWAVRRGRR